MMKRYREWIRRISKGQARLLFLIGAGALVIGGIAAMNGQAGPPTSVEAVLKNPTNARASIQNPQDAARVLKEIGVDLVQIETNARRLAEADAKLEATNTQADRVETTAAGIDRFAQVATLTIEEQSRARSLANAIREDAASLRESVAAAGKVSDAASAANAAGRHLLMAFENSPEFKTQGERDAWAADQLQVVRNTVKDLVSPEAAASKVEAARDVIERLESNLQTFAKEFGGQEYKEELAEAGISVEDIKTTATLIKESKDSLEQAWEVIKETAKRTYEALKAVAELAKDIAKAVWNFLTSLFGGGNGPGGNGGGEDPSEGPAGDVADTEGSGRGSGGKQEAPAPTKTAPTTDSKSDDPNGKPAVTTGANKGDGGGFKPGDKNLDSSGLYQTRPGGPRLPQGIGTPLAHVGAGVGPEGSTSYAVYATPEVVTIVEIIDSGNASSTRQFFIRAGIPLFKALTQGGAATPYIVNLQSVKARSDGKTGIQFSGLPRLRESDLVEAVFDAKGEMESVSGLVVQ